MESCESAQNWIRNPLAALALADPTNGSVAPSAGIFIDTCIVSGIEITLSASRRKRLPRGATVCFVIALIEEHLDFSVEGRPRQKSPQKES